MSKKVLTIDLELNTVKYEDGVARLGKSQDSIKDAIERQNNALNKQIATELQLDAALKEKQRLAEKYLASIDNIARSRLDEENKIRSAISLTNQLNAKLKEQVVIQNTLKAGTFAANLGASASQADSRGYKPFASGFVSENRAKVEKENLEKQKEANSIYAAFIKEQEELISRKHKEELDKQNFNTQASLNSRRAMYVSMFNEIEQREKQIAAKKGADNRGYTPFSSGFVQPKQSTAVSKVDARTISSAAPDLSYSFISGATRTIAAEQEKVAQKVKETSSALDSVTSKHKNILVHVGEIILSYRTLNTAINLIQQGLLSIPRAGIALESASASLTAIFKSSAGAGRELQFLREEADRTGISVNALRTSYSNASASFIAAGESAENTRKIFQNINTVVTTLHLNSDQTYGIYLALSQIFNKTKLQAEELTKQLAQTIPGVTNAQAQALNITVSELYDSMKKGAINAHDAVIRLSEVLANTYGQEAFATAANGLNANIGRLNTSWTLFAENVYKASSEMLIGILKFTTGSIEGISDLTNDTAKLKQTMQDLLIGLGSLATGYAVVTGAQALYARGVIEAGNNVSKFTTFINGLGAALKQLTFIGAIAELANFSAKLAAIQAQRNELFQDVADAQKIASATTPQEFAQYTAEADVQSKVVKAKLDFAKKELEKFKSGSGLLTKDGLAELDKLDKAVNFFDKKYIETVNKVKKELAKTDEQTKGTFTPSKVDASDAIARAEVDNLKATGNKIAAARKDFLNRNQKDIDILMAAYAQGNEEAGKALESLQKASLAQGIEKPTGGNGGGNGEALKENYKISFEAIKEAAKEVQLDVQDALGRIDELYQTNGITIKDYFTQKKALQEADLSVELDRITKEKELATISGDKVKVGKLENDYLRVQINSKKESVKTTQEQIAAEREYYALKMQNKAQFLESQGRSGEAARTQFDISTRGTFEKFAIEGDTQSLKELENNRQNVSLKAQLADFDNQRNLAEEEYQSIIDRTNVLVNIGAMSNLAAAREIEEANKKIIALKEKQLALSDQEIAKAKELGTEVDINVTAQNQKLRNEIEKLKLTADTTSQYFSRVMGDAFENSFASFVTGSQTASQAFTSFANSVVNSIAKIIAEELKSQMLSLLFSAGKGILGSFGGGGVSVAGGNSATFTSSMDNLFSGFKLANGGITSGLSSASSTVLTKPTLFPNAKVIPFATGGVLAGEAGAEAVLPLKRSKSGKLGVAMEGSQAPGNMININVSVARSQGEDDNAYAAKIAESIARRIAKEEVANGARTGNINNRITKFG
jgi:tape measure domain-containing protein